ncbi:unnamed protein product [Bathycoccus prasinos]
MTTKAEEASKSDEEEAGNQALPRTQKCVTSSNKTKTTKKALSGSNVDILHTFEKDRAIITHCGGGGRGQKSKEWLEKEGFTNVINGGGPQVSELWDMFGHL